MKHFYISTLALSLLSILGCKKEFLDKKPNTSILQPTTLDDFQGLLENRDITATTALGILGSDEHIYRSYSIWQSAPTSTERNSYIWAKDIFEGEIKKDWSIPFKVIFYSNSVLAGLDRIEDAKNDKVRFNMLKGWALFVRANAFYDLVRNFSAAYDVKTASTDLGIPLRLSPSVGEVLQRSSVQDTYNRILQDIQKATELLDSSLSPTNRNRPSKIAAYALLARIYLNMRDYNNAELSADNCLKIYDKLIDYNTLSLTSATPFQTLNDELIYFTQATAETYNSYLSASSNTSTVISKELIDLYQPNDLRLGIIYTKLSDGTYLVKRNVSGITTRQPFTGLATDEVFLIKAETSARRGDISTSMEYLNKLLIKRYITSKFSPVVALSATDALNKVLLERRKELVYRALRWDDLKRLNKEGANITITRELNGQIFTLPPNSPRYVLPIPDDEINLSGIIQNSR